jgi:hypothetical protein
MLQTCNQWFWEEVFQDNCDKKLPNSVENFLFVIYFNNYRTNLLRYLVSRCHWRVKTADQLKRAAIELWKVPTEVLGNICRLA